VGQTLRAIAFALVVERSLTAIAVASDHLSNAASTARP
jgi:hypothetical protein